MAYTKAQLFQTFGILWKYIETDALIYRKPILVSCKCSSHIQGFHYVPLLLEIWKLQLMWNKIIWSLLGLESQIPLYQFVSWFSNMSQGTFYCLFTTFPYFGYRLFEYAWMPKSILEVVSIVLLQTLSKKVG